MCCGILYGIGVGPGTADLLTLRAVRILQEVDAVLLPASPRNDYSLALKIASPYLHTTCQQIRLDFPMTRDKAVLSKAWAQAAQTTLTVLNSGAKAAFLTLGDPLIYSTFSYLAKTVQQLAPQTTIEIIPGITSFQAACAKTGVVLCEGADNVHLVAGINSADKLVQELTGDQTVILLKTYRNFPAIVQALRATGRSNNCLIISHVEQEGEKIQHGLEQDEEHPPYMSLILSPKKSSKNLA